MYKILLCDDNEIFLKEGENVIKNALSDTGCSISSFTNPSDAVSLIESGKVFDIAVLDIEMPEENGIDLARKIDSVSPDCKIIYITNHIGYVSDVYETNHTYFVLKSDMNKKLPSAIFKAIEEIAEQKNDFIVLSMKDKKIVVKISDILYCERNMRTTSVFTSEKTFSVSENLDKLFERLSEKNFTRCHKSFIVNMKNIKELYRNKYILENGNEVPISRNFAEQTKSDFAEFICEGV